ncbi:MAG: phosphodiester glycosidase family protein [Verrucomicrobiota bacterium JB023]|nr:phosphodiester glycosidase family protein [Verrucomicrobiota bacterium JB023]
MKAALLLTFLLSSLWSPGEQREVEISGNRYRVFTAEPDRIKMVWRDEQGVPLRTFDRARAHLERGSAEVAMLMNGGIFEPGLRPSGWYVEEGRTLAALNLRDGRGNFFLKPNGVFAILGEGESAKARVVEAGKAGSLAAPHYAVQSGPALLLGGKIHPAFREGSPNKLLRNGVGVDDKGRVVFVLTIDDVNLWTFASCFRELGCQEALFLDGDISRMVIEPDEGVRGTGYASFIAVMK